MRASCNRCSRLRLSNIGSEMKALSERGAFVNWKGNLSFRARTMSARAGVHWNELQPCGARPAPVRIESWEEHDAKFDNIPMLSELISLFTSANAEELPPTPVASVSVGRY